MMDRTDLIYRHLYQTLLQIFQYSKRYVAVSPRLLLAFSVLRACLPSQPYGLSIIPLRSHAP